MIRVAIQGISLWPVQSPTRGWTHWKTGTVYRVIRTDDQAVPVPPGYEQIEQGIILPVLDWEVEAEIEARVASETARLKKQKYLTPEKIEEIIEGYNLYDETTAARRIREQRGDPSHDGYVYVAPLRCDPEQAADEWLDAIEHIDTTFSHVVIRPNHSSHGWFAWTGLGSLLEPVTPPGWHSVTPGQRRKKNLLTGKYERVCPPAYWPDRQAAIDAGVTKVVERRRVLDDLLPDWEDEARQEFLSGEACNDLFLFRGVRYYPEIQIHEGPAAGNTSSWDLPVVETVTI